MPDSPMSYLYGIILWFAFSALLGVAYIGLVSFCRWVSRWWR